MICKHRINLLISFQKYINIVCNRNIYLSHLYRVRKPSFARRASNSTFEDIQEHSVAGVFDDPPKNVNAFKNFYGIESDEGVINVEEYGKAGKSIHDLKKMTFTPMNEYRSYNFGAVRLDNENKPSYAPRRRAKRYENDNKELNTQEKNTEQSNNQAQKTESELKNSLIQKNLFNYDEPEQVTFVCDERNQYAFSGVINSLPETSINDMKKDAIDNFTSNNLSADHHVTDSCKQNQLSIQDSSEVSESLIDKDYFNECCIENFVPHSEISSDKINLNTPKQLFNYDKHGQITYDINKRQQNVSSSVISSLTKSKGLTADKDAFESWNQNQFSNQDSPKVLESSIDKDYFDKYYTENPIPQTEESSDNFIEEQFFKQSSLSVSESDCKTVSIDQIKECYPPDSLAENLVTITEQYKPGEKYEKNTFKSHNENKFFHHKSETDFSQNINAQDQTKKVADISSQKSPAMSYEKNEQEKESLSKKTDKNKSSYDKLSTTKTDFTKQKEKNSHVSAQTQNSDEKVNSEKSLNSSDKLHRKKPSDENQIKTAFDFVKKLRGKNKLLSDEVKKGISAKKEKKVDSKGFRILKHQVPSLQYFTRDEMLELLKRSVLYTDEDVVILNKPYNLVVHESSTSQDLACLSRYLDDLAKLLDQHTNSPKLFTVHRLDKETTGCLLLARNEVSAARLKSLFAQRKIVKTYWIVTTKVPDPMEGIIDMPISEGTIEKRSRMVLHPKLPDDVPYVSHSKHGKQAITQYSVIAVSGNAALVEVRPETGIKHQIRVHFGFGLRCPILGDHKYSHLDKLVPQKLPSDLLQRLQVRQSKVRHIPLHIHSKHVLIPQYSNERSLFVTAPLPNHMSENLRFLKFKKK